MAEVNPRQERTAVAWGEQVVTTHGTPADVYLYDTWYIV